MVLLVAALLADAPRWLDHNIAGYELDHGEKFPTIGVYDPKRDFFLARTAECDGALLTLLLTRDRKLLTEDGFEFGKESSEEDGALRFVDRPLRSLATSKGVRIGMGVNQVARRLGNPTRKEHTGNRKQYVSLIYQTRQPGDPPTRHTQTYTFRSDRLVEIRFFRDRSAD